VLTKLTLPGYLRDEILSHVRDALPHEAVGLVGGSIDGLATTVVRLVNRATGVGSFFVDPYDQFCALRGLRSQSLELLSVYHSHPGGCHHLSDLDLLFARRWRCTQLVVGLGTGELFTPSLHAYRVTESALVEELPIFDRLALAPDSAAPRSQDDHHWCRDRSPS
jgi:proteasome lid subunit RPN8/RPN11